MQRFPTPCQPVTGLGVRRLGARPGLASLVGCLGLISLAATAGGLPTPHPVGALAEVLTPGQGDVMVGPHDPWHFPLRRGHEVWPGVRVGLELRACDFEQEGARGLEAELSEEGAPLASVARAGLGGALAVPTGCGRWWDVDVSGSSQWCPSSFGWRGLVPGTTL